MRRSCFWALPGARIIPNYFLKELFFYKTCGGLWGMFAIRYISRLAGAAALVGVPGADLGVGDLHVVEAGVAGHAEIVAGHLESQEKIRHKFLFRNI